MPCNPQIYGVWVVTRLGKGGGAGSWSFALPGSSSDIGPVQLVAPLQLLVLAEMLVACRLRKKHKQK